MRCTLAAALTALVLRTLSAERGLLDLELDLEAAPQNWNVEPAKDFPRVCPRGRLNMAGRYLVSSRLVIAGSCKLNAEADVEVELFAPMRVEGDVEFHGSFAFSTKSSLEGSCLEVIGNVTITANASVAFAGCSSSRLLPRTANPVDHCLGKLSFTSHGVEERKLPPANRHRRPAFLKELRKSAALLEVANTSIPKPPPLPPKPPPLPGIIPEPPEKVDFDKRPPLLGLPFAGPGAATRGCSAGALSVRGSLHQHGGQMTFKNCTSAALAGAVLVEGFLYQQAGSMEFLNCTARLGGALVVGGGFQADGSTAFRGCRASSDSAAHVQMGMNASGSLLFEDCFGTHGGALRIYSYSLQILGGNHSFRRCVTEANYAESEEWGKQSFALKDTGTVLWHDTAGGAAIQINRGILAMLNGTVTFEDCHTHSSKGGAVLLDPRLIGQAAGPGMVKFVQHGGRMVFTRCSSLVSGGAMEVASSCEFRQTGGSLEFNGCHTKQFGGALRVGPRVIKTGGALVFNNCFAAWGGGMYIDAYTGRDAPIQTAGSMAFSNCHADKGGGGLAATVREMRIEGGDVSFNDCSGAHGLDRFGGAMRLRHAKGTKFISKLHLSGGLLFFRNCTSQGGGGAGLFADKFTQVGGHFAAEDCTARNGGGLHVREGNLRQLGGTMRFRRCRAQETGGAVFSFSKVVLAHAEFEGCYAFATGNAIFMVGDADIASVKVTSDIAELSVSTVRGLGAALIQEADCSQVDSCGFDATFLEVKKLYCREGSGQTTNGTVCMPCPPEKLQLLSRYEGSCATCPKFAKICTGKQLNMLEGHMVSLSNLSHAYHCPNVKACPGGYLPGHDVPMCAPGYIGEGCSECNETTHAISDGSVLSCVRCARERRKQLLQLSFTVLRDIVLFWVAVAGVRGADTEKKHSAVLLNQLMSFAAVASSSLAAVTQTGIFVKMRGEVHLALRAANMAVELGGSSGGGGGGLSVQCLVSYLGLPKTLWHAHFLSAVVPSLLMASLALWGEPGLALVVGSNCFLPGFCADFGKYFVCFRVNKEEKAGGDLRCNFFPPWVPPPVLLAAIVLCFVVAIVAWTRAAYSTAMPPAKHVVYLNNAYKPTYAAWETERLVRKMLLKLLCAVLPITLSPALHMTGISLVLFASLGSYLVLSPYKVEIWNLAESILLTVAAVMTCLASCLFANDGAWGHSDLTQRILLCSVIGLASSVCLTMMVLIAIQMRRESASAKKHREALND